MSPEKVTKGKKVQARQGSKSPARIRIPNSMVEWILQMQPERPTMDVLQAQLMRLDESASSQADRIIVTQNDETLDLLRDWCTRLIADNRLSEDPTAKQLVASASKVIGFMDNHETRSEKAERHRTTVARTRGPDRSHNGRVKKGAARTAVARKTATPTVEA